MFWRQLYIITIVLFLGIIVFTGAFLIEINFEQSLSQVIKVQLDKEESIVSQIEMLGRDSGLHFQPSFVIEEYLYQNLMDLGYDTGDEINVFHDESLFYTSNESNFIAFDKFIETPTQHVMSYRMIDDQGVKKLQVGSKIAFSRLNFLRIKNIALNDVYAYRQQAYTLLATVGVALLLITSYIYYRISRSIMHPMEVIVDHVESIASGDELEPLDKKGFPEYEELVLAINYMQEEVKKAEVSLLEDNKRQSLFIRNMNHELRTPLTSILGYTNLLMDERANEKLKSDSAKFIHQEGKRLVELSKKMSDLIQVNDIDIHKEDIESTAIVEHLEAIYQKHERCKDVSFFAESFTWISNYDLLVMLAINLIDNAIKATHVGEKITVTIFSDRNSVNLTVADEGVGFDPEIMDEALLPFRKSSYLSSAENTGSGLGLSICANIAEVLDSQLNIVNKNKGSEVILTMPREESSNDI